MVNTEMSIGGHYCSAKGIGDGGIVLSDQDIQVDVVEDWGKEVESRMGDLVPNSQYQVYVVVVVQWVK